MRLVRPDEEVLRAYVYEELSEEDAAGVRHWLIAFADEDVLEALQALVDERRRHEAVLGSWVTQPELARMEWRWSKIRRRPRVHGEVRISSLRARPAELAALGKPSAPSDSPVIEVAPEETIDPVIQANAPCYVAAYALEASGVLQPLEVSARRLEAMQSVFLPGITLAAGEGELELFILFDATAPLPRPGPEDGVVWLTSLLESVEQNPERSAVRRTVRLTGSARKQS